MLYKKDSHTILQITHESVDREIDVLNSDNDEDENIVLTLENSDSEQVAEKNKTNLNIENCACLDNYENNNLISHEINSQNDKNTSYKRKFDGSSDVSVYNNEKIFEKPNKIRRLQNTNLIENFQIKDKITSKKQSSLLDYFSKNKNVLHSGQKSSVHTTSENNNKVPSDKTEVLRPLTIVLERINPSDLKKINANNTKSSRLPLRTSFQNSGNETLKNVEKKKNVLSEKYEEFLKSVILKCTKCNIIQKVKGAKMINCQKCTEAMKYNCKLCNCYSNTYPGILTHGRFCRGNTNQYFFCNECDYKHKKKCNIKYHIEKHHLESSNTTLYHCAVCKRSYGNKYDKAKHEKTCGIPPHLFCKFCPYKIKHASHLRNHIKNKHIKEIKSSSELDEIVKEILKKGEKLRAVSKKALCDGSHQVFDSNRSFYVSARINRYCSKCDEVVKTIGNKFLKNCPKCDRLFFYECKKCQRRNKSYNVIYNHVKYNCYPETMYECDHCNYKSSIKNCLENHILYTHSFKDYYKCSKCNKIARRESDHRRTCSLSIIFDCKICSFKTKVKGTFNRHMHKHLLLNETEKDAYDAEEIESINSEKADHTDIAVNKSVPINSENHTINKKDEETLSRILKLTICYCSKCKKSVARKNRITRCQKCNTKFTYSCGSEDCAKKYNRLTLISNHIFNFHIPRTNSYQCQACLKPFCRWDLLKKHQKYRCNVVHFYNCDHCSYKSKMKSNLVPHIKYKHMTLEKKKIECKKCGKTYNNERTMRSHSNYCGKEATFKCDSCNFKAKNKYKILSHLQLKHVHLFTNKSLKCSMCYLEFKNVYLFDEHVKKCVNNN